MTTNTSDIIGCLSFVNASSKAVKLNLKKKNETDSKNIVFGWGYCSKYASLFLGMINRCIFFCFSVDLNCFPEFHFTSSILHTKPPKIKNTNASEPNTRKFHILHWDKISRDENGNCMEPSWNGKIVERLFCVHFKFLDADYVHDGKIRKYHCKLPYSFKTKKLWFLQQMQLMLAFRPARLKELSFFSFVCSFLKILRNGNFAVFCCRR